MGGDHLTVPNPFMAWDTSADFSDWGKGTDAGKIILDDPLNDMSAEDRIRAMVDVLPFFDPKSKISRATQRHISRAQISGTFSRAITHPGTNSMCLGTGTLTRAQFEEMFFQALKEFL